MFLSTFLLKNENDEAGIMTSFGGQTEDLVPLEH